MVKNKTWKVFSSHFYIFSKLGVTQVTYGNDLGFWIICNYFHLNSTGSLCFKIHQAAYKVASPHSVSIFLEVLLKVGI